MTVPCGANSCDGNLYYHYMYYHYYHHHYITNISISVDMFIVSIIIVVVTNMFIIIIGLAARAGHGVDEGPDARGQAHRAVVLREVLPQPHLSESLSLSLSISPSLHRSISVQSKNLEIQGLDPSRILL